MTDEEVLVELIDAPEASAALARMLLTGVGATAGERAVRTATSSGR